MPPGPRLPSAPAGGLPHGGGGDQLVPELEGVQRDRPPAAVAPGEPAVQGPSQKRPRQEVEEEESGDEGRPAVGSSPSLSRPPGGAQEGAGGERPGPAGGLLSHGPGRGLQGQSQPPAHGRAVQVLVPCREQEG